MEANQQSNVHNIHRHHRSNVGRIFGGFILLIAGVLLLARETGLELPWWLFTWPMLLIIIGLFIGVRHSFRGWAWLILMVLGLFFFMDEFIQDFRLKNYLWPSLIILIGLIMIFKTRRSHQHHSYNYSGEEQNVTGNASYDDYLDVVTILGGMKKNIISKDFKGGEVVSILGGTELNLTGAVLTRQRTLELTQIFGGTKLIVPSDWVIQTDEVVAILGGVSDKRTIHPPQAHNHDMILRLKGTCIFGGIDIVSY